MSYKNKEKQLAARRAWYSRNKEKEKDRVVAATRLRRQAARDYINALKESLPCYDCNEFFPYYVTEWDHTGTDKEFNVSVMVHNTCSIEKIMREIAKCELVCANCHKIRTHKRRTLP